MRGSKAKLLGLLDEAAAGEEFEITKHGRPVARLVHPFRRRSQAIPRTA